MLNYQGPDHYINFHFKNVTVSVVEGRQVLYLESNEKFLKVIRDFIEKIQIYYGG